MSYVNFGKIPPFVCIKSVHVRQFWPAIAQHLFPLLKQFSGNYIDALKFHLDASIDLHHLAVHSQGYDRSFDELFASQMEFVSCLRKMLEIFEQCSSQLNFCLYVKSFRMDSLSLITSTLELSSVQASENVHFILPALGGYYFRNNQHSFQNQVKVISDWLHRPYGSGGNHRSKYIRTLTIGSIQRGHRLTSISEDNVVQLIDDLKVASFLFKF